MKSNYKLSEDQSWIMKSILQPYDLRATNMIKCTFLLWLACFIIFHGLLESTKYENTTWNSMTSFPLGVACFSGPTLLIASTKHLKCFSDHHFHVSLPSTTLGLPIHRRQAPILGRSDLSSKNHSWHSLEITWLIDPSDELNLMSNLDSFFKSFPFYQMIFNNL